MKQRWICATCGYESVGEHRYPFCKTLAHGRMALLQGKPLTSDVVPEKLRGVRRTMTEARAVEMT